MSHEPEYLNPETGLEEPRFWISNYPDFNTRDTLNVPFINEFYFDFNNGVPERAYVDEYELVKNEEQDICLVFKVTEPTVNTTEFIRENITYHLNCYNITQSKWIYKNKSCGGGAVGVPIFDNLHIVGTSGDENSDFVGLWAYDWRSGEEVWYMGHDEFNTDLQLSFGYTGYDPDSGVMVINSVGYIYGIDATKGELLWRSKGIGNLTSPILFHHGVAYAITSDGALYGHDVMTGERLLRASCPSEGREVNGRILPGFLTNIAMHITENDKAIIFARNYMYAYAFEGVR